MVRQLGRHEIGAGLDMFGGGLPNFYSFVAFGTLKIPLGSCLSF